MVIFAAVLLVFLFYLGVNNIKSANNLIDKWHTDKISKDTLDILKNLAKAIVAVVIIICSICTFLMVIILSIDTSNSKK